MRMKRCLVMAVALFASGEMIGQTIYKSVDEKGNVSYSENPPAADKRSNKRSTTELSIDPNRNVIPAQLPLGRERGRNDAAGNNAGGDLGSPKSRLDEARDALESAEEQLKAAEQTQPGDFTGKAGGGVRPSAQRRERLESLQRAVDEARDALGGMEGE